MSRHRTRRSTCNPWLAMALSMGATTMVGLGASTQVAAADGAPNLEEPMQPIAKDGAKAPVCRTCALTDLQDGGNQRLVERAAPEYAAPTTAASMNMTMPSDEGDRGPLVSVMPVGPDPDAGSVLSVPGASVVLPVVIR